MAFTWNDTSILRDNGEQAEAKAPVIISASRSTDIPAFHSKWFFNRLVKGYCAWYNPFDKSKPNYISFEKVKLIVFWTKNPEPIIPYLKELDGRGIHYYFQYTLNDYEKEDFEPGLPPLEKRIETFKRLSNMIGKNKVIWRFDPMIITDRLSVRDLLTRVWRIGNQIKGLSNKLVFSFVDINAYRKVQNNLVRETVHFSKETIENAELRISQINELSDGLLKIREAWSKANWIIEFATCSEEIDLDHFGISHNKCIDDDLIRELFPLDTELMYFLDYGILPDSDQKTLFESLPKIKKVKNLKDKGQRLVCGCMVSKDIGMYNTCPHHCVYCYANTSRTMVVNNMKKHNPDSESIID